MIDRNQVSGIGILIDAGVSPQSIGVASKRNPFWLGEVLRYAHNIELLKEYVARYGEDVDWISETLETDTYYIARLIGTIGPVDGYELVSVPQGDTEVRGMMSSKAIAKLGYAKCQEILASELNKKLD